MKRRNTFFLLVVTLVMSAILVACGGDGNEDKTNNDGIEEKAEGGGEGKLAEDQTLNVNIKSEPPSLNPLTSSDTTSNIILRSLFEGLMRLDQESIPQEAMAESYEVSDDKLTYTFNIREDVHWTNGDPVTAQDFEYAWKWVLTPESKDTAYSYHLYPIKGAQAAKEDGGSLDDVGIEVIDDKTLEVTLEEPTAYFLELLAFPTYFPINHKVAEQNEDWASGIDEYVSNGPFEMEDWDYKNQITLKKFDEYWDADTVKLETINMLMIEDENTAKQMYDNGELDWIGRPLDEIPFAAIPSYEESGELQIATSPAVYYYVINTEKEPFNNANIRKALALSINRQGIVDSITKKQEPPAMSFVPPTIFEENNDGYFNDNDIEQAKDYLEKGMKELGIEELPTIELSYNTSEKHADIAQAIQDMWKNNLGIDVSLHNEEWAVFLDRLAEGNYQIGRYGWGADYMDAINFLELFESKDRSNNLTKWEDDEYKEIIEKTRTETDIEARYELMRKAEEILMDEMPIIPIFYETIGWANKDYVKNIEVSPLSTVQFKWGYIEEH